MSFDNKINITFISSLYVKLLGDFVKKLSDFIVVEPNFSLTPQTLLPTLRVVMGVQMG